MMGTNRFLSTANCMCASRGGDKITIEILMILATIGITASGPYFSSKIVEHTRMTRYSSDELRSASKGLFIWKWGPQVGAVPRSTDVVKSSPLHATCTTPGCWGEAPNA